MLSPRSPLAVASDAGTARPGRFPMIAIQTRSRDNACPPQRNGRRRTYRQIARILARTSGPVMSPSRVRATCRRAERKLIRALLTDVVVLDLLGPLDARDD